MSDALDLLQREERELEERLAKVRKAIEILSAGKPELGERPGRKPRVELGRILDVVETYKGLKTRVYEIPFEAMLGEFRGKKAQVGQVVDFLKQKFGFKSGLTARAYLSYAERKGIAQKQGRSVTFK